MNEPPGAASFFQPRILLPFALVTLIWGSTWLVIRDQVGSVPPGWSVVWRFVLAGGAMFALAAIRRDSLRPTRAMWPLIVAMGVFQFVANFQFVYAAERHLTSGIVAVMFAFLMVPNALLGRIFVDQPVSRGFLAGSAVALAGVALLLLHEYRIAPLDGRVLLGVALTIGGIMGASIANVIQASEAARRQPLLPLLAWSMLFGASVDAILSWGLYGPPQFEPRWGYAAGIAYLAIMGSVVTFPLYFTLVRALGPGRAAYNSVLVPIIAMLLSTLFEGYRWSTLAVAGSVVALVGLVIALKARSPSRKVG
ncbi:MAG TPA: EamA family transporter [Novosphingobium sp.]|nr:EamA family transporter [Novosphingobium sp.]